jgi:hypothetical protein
MRRVLACLLAATGLACFGEDGASGSGTASAGDSGSGSGEAGSSASTVGTTSTSGPTSGVDTSGEATVGESVGEGGEECGPATVCVPPPPPDWIGPIAVANGMPRTPAAPCPADYPDALLFAIEGLDAGVLECPCACGPSTGSCVASATAYGMNGCMGLAAAPVVLVPGECTLLNGSPQSVLVQANEMTGSCQPFAGPPRIPTATWNANVTVCGGAQLETCAQGVCAPLVGEPFASSVCVMHPGEDQDCPGGGWVERRVVLGDFEDARSCGECGCGDPAGVMCDGGLSAYSGNGCMIEDGPHDSGTCVPLTLGVENKVQYDPPSLGACEPAVEVVGEVLHVDPWTICCLP